MTAINRDREINCVSSQGLSKSKKLVTIHFLDFQREAYMERLAKERLREAKLRSKSEETFLVCCYRCDQVVCRSTELVCLHETHHTIIDPELDNLIKVSKSMDLVCFQENNHTVIDPKPTLLDNLIITPHQRSCVKVLISVKSVCLFTGEWVPSPHYA